jgi:hypothetical protein
MDAYLPEWDAIFAGRSWAMWKQQRFRRAIDQCCRVRGQISSMGDDNKDKIVEKDRNSQDM